MIVSMPALGAACLQSIIDEFILILKRINNYHFG